MNFAYICFEKGEWEKGHIPDFIRHIYIRYFKREKIRKINMLGTEGDIITLPFKKNEPDFELISNFIGQMLSRNSLYDYRGLAVQDGLKSFVKNICTGELFSAFFADDIIKKMCGEITEESELQVTVSDGGDIITQIVLECLSKLPIRINLLTDNRNETEKMLEDIYSRTGLCINTFASERSRAFQNADVYIKCRSFEKSGLFVKKNCVYLDFTDNYSDFLLLAKKRKDLQMFYAHCFKNYDKTYPSSFCEAVCEAVCDDFFKIAKFGFETERFDVAYKFLHRYFSVNDCEKLTMRVR